MKAPTWQFGDPHWIGPAARSIMAYEQPGFSSRHLDHYWRVKSVPPSCRSTGQIAVRPAREDALGRTSSTEKPATILKDYVIIEFNSKRAYLGFWGSPAVRRIHVGSFVPVTRGRVDVGGVVRCGHFWNR